MRRSLCTAACAAACGGVQAQSVSIEHEPVGCVVADRFPVLEARFQPDAEVGRARVLFRAGGSERWYYVDMKREQKLFRGTLPKPLPATLTIDYYVDVVAQSLAEARTADYSAAVMGAGQCGAGVRVAASSASATIAVGSLAPGAAALPAGFSSVGITGAAGTAAAAAPASGTAASGAGAAASGGGGISTTTILGVAGAGVVAGGVALAATRSSSTLDVTGHWVGQLLFDQTRQGGCDIERDLVADLTQTGTSITGSGSSTTRRSTGGPDCGRDTVSLPFTGSLVGEAITLSSPGSGSCVVTLTGNVSGNSMAGIWSMSSGCGSDAGAGGTWNLTRP